MASSRPPDKTELKSPAKELAERLHAVASDVGAISPLAEYFIRLAIKELTTASLKNESPEGDA